MTEQDKEHMRIMFAGFALAGAIMSRDSWTPEKIWSIADDMVETKDKEGEELGIAAVKPRRRYNRKGT
jgi:hypothetical protein